MLALEKIETGRRPKYKQVKDYLVQSMQVGHFDISEPLPPETKLAKDAGISRTTVRQALGELEQEGVIKRHKGRGTFVVEGGIPAFDNNSKESLAVFAVILPELHRNLYPSLVKGLDQGAEIHKHRLIVCSTDNDVSKQGDRILEFIDRAVTGVVIVPTNGPVTPSYHVNQLQKNNIPVVFCHRPVAGASAPLVTWEGRKVGEIAAEECLRRGHTRIAYAGLKGVVIAEANMKGVEAALFQDELTSPTNHVLWLADGPLQNNANAKLFKKTLSDPERPTAIVCYDDYLAELLFYVATDMGLRVPQDLSIVGFGDNHRQGPIREKLASVVVDETELGSRAAELLFEMCSGRRPLDNNETIKLSLSLTSGQTLGPAPHV